MKFFVLKRYLILSVSYRYFLIYGNLLSIKIKRSHSIINVIQGLPGAENLQSLRLRHPSESEKCQSSAESSQNQIYNSHRTKDTHHRNLFNTILLITIALFLSCNNLERKWTMGCLLQQSPKFYNKDFLVRWFNIFGDLSEF